MGSSTILVRRFSYKLTGAVLHIAEARRRAATGDAK
jgi:hypothetical protein